MSSRQGTSAASGSKRREYRKFRNNAGNAKPKPIVCKYFSTPEGCRFSDSCRFKHDTMERVPEEMEKLSLEEVKVEPVVYQPPVPAKNQGPIRPRIVKLTKEETGGESQKEQRSSEISFFRKRYPYCKIDPLEDGTTLIVFRYLVTDPDWIFEVKTLTFQLILDPGHPIAIPKVRVPEEPNACLPRLVQSHLEAKINEAIGQKYALFEKRDAYETIGKSLILWLDHSVLQIFVDGLRRTKLALNGEDIGLRLVRNDGPEEDRKEPEVPEEPEKPESPEEPEEPSPGHDMKPTKSDESQPRPALPINIVMIFKDHSGNVATIRPISLKITVRCSRCSTERDIEIVSPSSTDDETNVIGWRCGRCAQAESVRMRSAIAHQHSNVIGHAHATGCKPIDCVLLDSKFRIVCLACDREDDLQKLNYGDTHKSWCRGCHQLLEMSVSHIRFIGDASSGEDRHVASEIPKAKKAVVEKRTGIIEEGQPLPNTGTCEHYRKSFRWFRFPCCGKLYPCDTCHEEKTRGEHEMKQANRMVCGRCSKEQPFLKDKPCISCGESTTRRRTQFWEGGKGCRDQTKMNRNDAHKFANSRKKTVAKGNQEKLAVKK